MGKPKTSKLCKQNNKRKQDRLCGRRFAYLNNNPKGIHNRLTKQANTEIILVSGVMSKDTPCGEKNKKNCLKKNLSLPV